MRRRVGRKLQVHDVEGLRDACEALERHRGADGYATEMRDRSCVDRAGNISRIRLAAAKRDDVGEGRVGLKGVRQLEYIALQTAEIVVRIAPGT